MIPLLSWLSIAFVLFLPMLVMPPLFDPPCTIFTDDFATDRTGTDYTAVSGSFTVSGGEITTTSAGAIIVSNTAGTFGHGSSQIRAKLTNSATTARVIGSYVDSSNFVYTELTINGATSTLKLFKRVAGVNTQLGSTLTFTGSTGTYYAIRVCWDGTNAIGTAATIGGITGAFTGTGNKAGFGASPGAGTATFDDFTFSNLQADNSACNDCTASDTEACTICLSSLMPEFVKVVISGIANGDCNACTDLNGTYIFEAIGSGTYFPVCDGTADLSACSWAYRIVDSTPPCENKDAGGADTNLILYFYKSGNDYYLDLQLTTPAATDPSYAGPTPWLNWRGSVVTSASAPNCFVVLDGVTLSPICSIFNSPTHCDSTSSSVTVSVA